MSTSASEAPRRDGGAGLRLLARVIFGLTLLGIVAGICLAILDTRSQGLVLDDELHPLPDCGYLLATRRPDNAVSWLTLGVGAALGLSTFLGAYASYAIHTSAGGSRIGEIAEAIDQPMWIPVVAIPATFLLLLFPDWHLPSPRWRWFARILGGGLVFIFLVILVGPGPIESSSLPRVPNPLGLEFLRPFLSIALASILPSRSGRSDRC